MWGVVFTACVDFFVSTECTCTANQRKGLCAKKAPTLHVQAAEGAQSASQARCLPVPMD